MKKSLIAILACLAIVSVKAENVPAFPGAEGFARYTTTGGRGGQVYHVTSLKDDGSEGTLRWCVKQSGPKTIVFDVSGYIDLQSDLAIDDGGGKTTIAGQTAPAPGITIRYRTVTVTKNSNVIVRYIRFRRSQVKDVNDGADACWGRQKNNIIFDHCSFSWSIDEIASFYDNRNFTMQWCNLNEALANPGHSKGEHSYGGIWGGKGASFHHNFLSHMQNRVPRFNGARYQWSGYDTNLYPNYVQAERVDFRNCVMYNWGSGGCYGGPGGGYINIINNYYQAGPGTSNKNRVTQVTVGAKGNSTPEALYGYTSRYYINGNYVSSQGSKAANYDWNGVVYDGLVYTIDGKKYSKDPNHLYGNQVEYVKNSDSVDCVSIRIDEPIEAGEVTTHLAQVAYEKVLTYGGACLWRDACDVRYAEEARTGTCQYTGTVTKRAGIIDKVNDPSQTEDPALVSYPELTSQSRPAGYDTDRDGMPDTWEDLNGLDKNNPTDRNLYTLDTEKGWYTNLEVYLNSLVESVTKAQNADAETSVDEYYPACVTAVERPLSESAQIVRFEYFDLNGRQLDEPQTGISIRRMYFSDGSILSDKVLKK